MEFSRNTSEIFGDIFLIWAAVSVLYKVTLHKYFNDISIRSLILWGLAYACRTIDCTATTLTMNFVFVKYFFLICIFSGIVSMYVQTRKSQDVKLDTFRIDLLIIPIVILACYTHYGKEMTLDVVANTFSIYLEAVAFLPQSILTSKLKKIDLFNFLIISSMIMAKACYLCNNSSETDEEPTKSPFEISESYNQKLALEKIIVIGTLVEIVMYCDYFARLLYIIGTQTDENGQRPVIVQKAIRVLRYFKKPSAEEEPPYALNRTLAATRDSVRRPPGPPPPYSA